MVSVLTPCFHRPRRRHPHRHTVALEFRNDKQIRSGGDLCIPILMTDFNTKWIHRICFYLFFILQVLSICFMLLHTPETINAFVLQQLRSLNAIDSNEMSHIMSPASEAGFNSIFIPLVILCMIKFWHMRHDIMSHDIAAKHFVYFMRHE